MPGIHRYVFQVFALGVGAEFSASPVDMAITGGATLV
jgi:hypothetical protein